MHITLKHIQQLESIARHGNFHKAARELNISQPALSRSIAVLEEQLGLKLLDRTTRAVIPTLYGQQILHRGKMLLREMRFIQRDLSLLRNMDAGELYIGSGPFPAQTIIGKALGKFCRDYPRININVIIDRTPKLLKMLRNRELDLFVADLRIIRDQSQFSIIPLPNHQGYFCCRPNHPITLLAEPTTMDICKYPLAIMWMPTAVRTLLYTYLDPGAQSPSGHSLGVIQCDSLKVLNDIVSASDAIGLTTRIAIDDPSGQSLHLLPLVNPHLTTNYGIVRLKEQTLSPAIRFIEQYIVETEEKIRGR